MRLRHIEVFHAIMQTGSITKAADLLNVSQPAASKVLQHAESSLGFSLFERVKGRLHPTVEAEILYVQVTKLHQGFEQLKTLSLNLKKFPQGHLHVGCLPSIGLSIIPKAIRNFREFYPSVTCEVETNHVNVLVDELRSRNLDLAVTLGADQYPDIRSQSLGEAELVYLGPQGGPDIHLSDIARGELICLSLNDPIGKMIANNFAQLGLFYKPAIEVQTYYLACALVAAGCGATIVDEFTAHSMIREGLAIRRVIPKMTATLAVLTHESHVIRGFYPAFTEILKRTLLIKA